MRLGIASTIIAALLLIRPSVSAHARVTGVTFEPKSPIVGHSVTAIATDDQKHKVVKWTCQPQEVISQVAVTRCVASTVVDSCGHCHVVYKPVCEMQSVKHTVMKHVAVESGERAFAGTIGQHAIAADARIDYAPSLTAVARGQALVVPPEAVEVPPPTTAVPSRDEDGQLEL